MAKTILHSFFETRCTVTRFLGSKCVCVRVFDPHPAYSASHVPLCVFQGTFGSGEDREKGKGGEGKEHPLLLSQIPKSKILCRKSLHVDARSPSLMKLREVNDCLQCSLQQTFVTAYTWEACRYAIRLGVAMEVSILRAACRHDDSMSADSHGPMGVDNGVDRGTYTPTFRSRGDIVFLSPYFLEHLLNNDCFSTPIKHNNAQ